MVPRRTTWAVNGVLFSGWRRFTVSWFYGSRMFLIATPQAVDFDKVLLFFQLSKWIFDEDGTLRYFEKYGRRCYLTTSL